MSTEDFLATSSERTSDVDPHVTVGSFFPPRPGLLVRTTLHHSSSSQIRGSVPCHKQVKAVSFLRTVSMWNIRHCVVELAFARRCWEGRTVRRRNAVRRRGVYVRTIRMCVSCIISSSLYCMVHVDVVVGGPTSRSFRSQYLHMLSVSVTVMRIVVTVAG